MRINKIEIKNYRQHQSIFFNFLQNREHDLHIIVAQNGVGKTNLLNAITWCLYKKEPHLGSEVKDKGLPIINLKALALARDNGQTTEDVEVSILAQENERNFIFKRKISYKINPELFENKHEFQVIETDMQGNSIIHEGDLAKMIVEKYMPEKIREYFYFDGEQLNDYFLENNGERVYDAIVSISQVDVLRRIQEHLASFISKKNREVGKKFSNIEEIRLKLDDIQTKLNNSRQDYKELEVQIATSDKKIREIDKYLQGQERIHELESRRALLVTQEKDLNLDFEKLRKKKIEFIQSMKIALSLHNSAKLVLEIISNQQANNNLPPSIDKEMLKEILTQKSCLICGQHISEKEELFIHNLLEKFQISSQTSHTLLSIQSNLRNILEIVKNYPTQKTQIISSHQQLEKRMAETRQELQKIHTIMSGISNTEMIKLRFDERENHMELYTNNNKKLGSYEVQIKNLEKEQAEWSERLDKAYKIEHSVKHTHKQIRFATKCKILTSDIEQEMKDEIRVKMEQQTAKYFLDLIWKKQSYTKDSIVLDPSFQLDLVHKDGHSCIATSSAAERCLLALSFTLALHEVSGFQSLLFIDTPIARISDQNRINFAEKLVQASKNKQIILTLTPDEFSPEVESRFEPVASTFAYLQLNDEQFTSIGA